jgi:hypothetical protein
VGERTVELLSTNTASLHQQLADLNTRRHRLPPILAAARTYAT